MDLEIHNVNNVDLISIDSIQHALLIVINHYIGEIGSTGNVK